MEALLTRDFLISLVTVEDFQVNFKSVSIHVVCIENDIDVPYLIELFDLVYCEFLQDEAEEYFNVIDTFLKRGNEVALPDSTFPEDRTDFWVLEFLSGLIRLTVGFKTLKLTKL